MQGNVYEKAVLSLGNLKTIQVLRYTPSARERTIFACEGFSKHRDES